MNKILVKKKVKTGRKTDSEIREIYLKWLCDLVDRRKMDIKPDSRYRELARLLHQRDFYVKIPKDVNRAEDGKKLRELFAESGIIDEYAMDFDYPCLGGPCSVLEMLIALSMRIPELHDDRRTGNQVAIWFWQMVSNLDLKLFEEYEMDAESIKDINDDIITIFLERKYAPNGKGGGCLFPLENPPCDVRDLELWYQLQYYLDERYPL